MSDNVNHPTHYLKAAVTIEPIELTSRMTSCIGQALQYIFRAPYKGNQIEDLKKAVFYLKKQLNVGGYDTVYTEAFPYITIFTKHTNGLIKKALESLFTEYYPQDDIFGYMVDPEGLKETIEIIESEIRNLEKDAISFCEAIEKDEEF